MLHVFIGTKAQYIKTAPVIRELENRKQSRDTLMQILSMLPADGFGEFFAMNEGDGNGRLTKKIAHSFGRVIPARAVEAAHPLPHHLVDLPGDENEFLPGPGVGHLRQTLAARDKTWPITGPVSLVEAVMELGRRGIDVQRYKGLGEMNPEQLWETTLDPEIRSLLQVKINHADSAEETFSTLMGDLVEPRRDFIQANALSVANLDV